jgi:drug/metabolite transporter (DMT)-like permease
VSTPPLVRTLPRSAVIAGIAVGVLAVSTAAILIRLAEAPSLALAFWRCFLGALALAPFALRHRGTLALDRAQTKRLVASGLFLALHFALFISALSFTTVASAAVLVTMSPLFVGAGAALFLSEPPSRRTWVGIALAGAGALAVGVADFGAADLGRRALLGDALAFGGAVAVAGYLLLGRLARRHVPVTVYAAAVYGVAAAALLVVCLLTGTPLAGYDAGTWLAIAGLVVGPQLLGHTVFNGLLSTVTATVVAVAVIAEPVGATILAWLVLAELPTPWFWLGAPFILAGVWLAASAGTRGDPQPAPAPPPPQ